MPRAELAHRVGSSAVRSISSLVQMETLSECPCEADPICRDFARDQLGLDAPTGDIAACAAYMESVSASNHLLEKFMMTNKEFTHFRRAHSEQSTYMRRSSAFA